ncbi:hypothetical protein PtA15_3A157 [Puccinia triticina]|uniref:F-box domain-containing protein n=1 Tax=Puccinia triticina TaxID=208348 RepID=A0ABY7CC45_9BASI|nr:uncharacterized protein PtA15_3A157 [Puccinia triticina]WAQ82793.1 hypothetical protein PtA15_3A157 [Puccinia triticina]
MAKILDLPWHVFEVIYKYVIKEGDSYLWLMLSGQAEESPPGARTKTAKLRLVCRQWADWLYVHYLYRTITFGSASRTMRFIINQITRRSKHLPRATCHNLQVTDILNWGPPPREEEALGAWTDDTITFEILEALIELFSDTIVHLNLRFWNVMSLPARTIETIGRIENLRTLTLSHELPDIVLTPRDPLFPLYHDSDDDDIEEDIRQYNARLEEGETMDDEAEPRGDMDPVKSKIDSDCLKSLLLATRKLQLLDISDLDPICLPKPIKSSLCGHQILPTVTQLEASLDGQSLSRLIDLSIVLKGTLKVLSLKNSYDGNYGRNLVPVFENLHESLEGLFVTDDKLLEPVMHFKFPKLRVFKTVFWDGPLANLLEKPMIAQSPIEVLALRSDSVNDKPKGKSHVKPFSNLPMLKRLVFCDVSPGYSAPPAYTKACHARRVKCVYLGAGDSQDLSLIMKL